MSTALFEWRLSEPVSDTSVYLRATRPVEAREFVFMLEAELNGVVLEDSPVMSWVFSPSLHNRYRYAPPTPGGPVLVAKTDPDYRFDCLRLRVKPWTGSDRPMAIYHEAWLGWSGDAVADLSMQLATAGEEE